MSGVMTPGMLLTLLHSLPFTKCHGHRGLVLSA